MTAEELARQNAARVLYQNHHGWLHGWLRRRLGGSSDVADLAHDTFLRIFQHQRLEAIAADQNESRSFLTHVANGLVIDWWRRRNLESAWQETLASLPEDMAPSPESHMLVMDVLVRIDRMFDKLPPRAREAFLLSQFGGLTYPDIAKRLGVSPSMVQKYMLQAIRECHAIFSE